MSSDAAPTVQNLDDLFKKSDLSPSRPLPRAAPKQPAAPAAESTDVAGVEGGGSFAQKHRRATGFPSPPPASKLEPKAASGGKERRMTPPKGGLFLSGLFGGGTPRETPRLASCSTASGGSALGEASQPAQAQAAPPAAPPPAAPPPAAPRAAESPPHLQAHPQEPSPAAPEPGVPAPPNGVPLSGSRKDVSTQCRPADFEKMHEAKKNKAERAADAKKNWKAGFQRLKAQNAMASLLGDMRASRASSGDSAMAGGRNSRGAPLQDGTRAYFKDLDEIASDDDDEEEQTCAKRYGESFKEMSVALCPMCDGSEALKTALGHSSERSFLLLAVAVPALLTWIFLTGSTCPPEVAGAASGCPLGLALPRVMSSLCVTALLSALAPPAMGNAMMAIRTFPVMKSKDLPWTGLWLGLPLPFAVLVQLLFFVPLAALLVCSYLLLSGASLDRGMSDGELRALSTCANLSASLAISAVAAWVTLIRLSLTGEVDEVFDQCAKRDDPYA